MSIKISIIIPSYNQGQFIEETILSILNQKYKNLELIVIDGGSSDSTFDIIEKYKDKIDYHVSEKDRGQGHAINKGFSKATGDVVTWLCSDDTYLAGALEYISNFFERNTDCDLVYGNVLSIDSKSNVFNKKRGVPFSRSAFFCAVGSIPQPASFFRKEMLNKIGNIDERFEGYFMDYDLFARMITIGAKVIHVNKFLATYRYHDLSKTVTVQGKRNEYKKMRSKHLKAWSEYAGVNYSYVQLLRPFWVFYRIIINIDLYVQVYLMGSNSKIDVGINAKNTGYNN